MRTKAAALAFAVAATWTAWSPRASAQLQPPPPMQPPPPAWGIPGMQPAPVWGAPQPVPPQGMPPSATQQQLNASDNATSFRGFEIVYANAEVGGTYVTLGSKLGSNSGEGGAAFGAGVGVRFLTWTLGLRARVAPLSDFTLIQANLEAGFHLPLGAWDPYVNIHGGYVTAPLKNAGSFPSPNGFDLGGSLGADYYFTALLSLGLDATADALFLSAASQSSVGSALIGSLHLGLHFDL